MLAELASTKDTELAELTATKNAELLKFQEELDKLKQTLKNVNTIDSNTVKLSQNRLQGNMG